MLRVLVLLFGLQYNIICKHQCFVFASTKAKINLDTDSPRASIQVDISCLEIIWFVVFFLFLVELHDRGEYGAPVLGGELPALGGLASLLQVNLTLHHPDTLTHTIWIFIWQTKHSLCGPTIGCRTPSPLPLREKRQEKIIWTRKLSPLLPTGIGERYSQTISNLGHEALADVNSPYKRKCWTNSGGLLVNSVPYSQGPTEAIKSHPSSSVRYLQK